MKKEVYVCDNCKQVIYTGVILRGVLTGIGFQDIIGIIAGGKEEDEYHYCYSCIACLTRTFKLPNKQTTRYSEEEKTDGEPKETHGSYLYSTPIGG